MIEKVIKEFELEIADTPQDLQNGLMWRKNLPENTAMLFHFADKNYVSFWSKNTYIPLDLVFLDDEGKVLGQEELIPMSTKIVSSQFPCRYAVEANRGSLSSINLKDVRFNIDKKAKRLSLHAIG